MEMFHGKTVAEAELLFRENGLFYQEDLMWMGPIGFVFYFPAALAYLLSEHSAEDADFVSSMISLMEFRLDEENGDAEEIRGAFPDMLAFCRYTLENYDRFELDPDIYGDLRPKTQALIDRLS